MTELPDIAPDTARSTLDGAGQLRLPRALKLTHDDRARRRALFPEDDPHTDRLMEALADRIAQHGRHAPRIEWVHRDGRTWRERQRLTRLRRPIVKSTRAARRRNHGAVPVLAARTFEPSIDPWDLHAPGCPARH